MRFGLFAALLCIFSILSVDASIAASDTNIYPDARYKQQPGMHVIGKGRLFKPKECIGKDCPTKSDTKTDAKPEVKDSRKPCTVKKTNGLSTSLLYGSCKQ
jgi:hypothetical protein